MSISQSDQTVEELLNGESYGEKDQANEEEWLFSCRCESAKAITTLLSCLRSVSGGETDEQNTSSKRGRKSQSLQPVVVFCSQNNITFQVFGMARQSQASVEMQAGLFSDYRVFSETADFCVNLRVAMDCLHVLGLQSLERTKLSMSYNLREEIFKLELLEEGVLSTAAIPGILPPDDSGTSLTQTFRASPIVARLIVKSEPLREALQELELCAGAYTCSVALGPHGLQLACAGNMSECVVSLPAGALNTIVNLEAPNACVENYPLHSFLSGMKALDIADETCISINASGMIAIQHQILDFIGQGAPNFADFIMACLVDDDEGDEQTDIHRPIRAVSSENWDEDQDETQTVTPSEELVSVSASVVQSDKDERSDEDEPPPSSQPLFESLTTSRHSRKKRRKRRIAQDEDDEDSGVSVSLDLDDEENELDIAEDAPATPPRRSRRSHDEETFSSSPELVYK